MANLFPPFQIFFFCILFVVYSCYHKCSTYCSLRKTICTTDFYKYQEHRITNIPTAFARNECINIELLCSYFYSDVVLYTQYFMICSPWMNVIKRCLVKMPDQAKISRCSTNVKARVLPRRKHTAHEHWQSVRTYFTVLPSCGRKTQK